MVGRDQPAQTPSTEQASLAAEEPAERKKGHGRNGADSYPGANRIKVPHESLKAGDPCPDCEQGTVYAMSRPGVLIRFVGQPPITAAIYELEKLRCNLCGEIFTAQAPEGIAGAEKYDATVASMVALLKYGTGQPFHRQDKLQKSLGVPLPASTQWDIVAAAAPELTPASDELIRQAAQGTVVHNDDTTVKILELMHAKEKTASDEEDPSPDSSQRTGTFTSGIVATSAGHRIALFFSGRKHGGENLADVLRHRAVDLPPPIQMCDALSRNLPKEFATIVANCLAHGRRQFVDINERFPDETRYVLEALEVVYRNDSQARQRQMTDEERLAFHQAESGPVMDGVADVALPAVRRTAGGTEFGTGRGDQLPRPALGEADAISPAAGCPAGQQHLRTGAQKGDPAPQERLLLQDPQRRRRRRSVHEPDPHLRAQRGQPVRLPHRAAATRRRSGRCSGRVDAVELHGQTRRAGCRVVRPALSLPRPPSRPCGRKEIAGLPKGHQRLYIRHRQRAAASNQNPSGECRVAKHWS